MFIEIQTYKSMGLNKSQVSKKLKINFKTVCKYWNISPSTFQTLQEQSKSRTKKIDPYHNQILEWLREFPDLSSAQVFDWLLERHHNLDFKERTLRLYIQELRKTYALPKHPPLRQYEEVPETLPGEQAQADFGQIWVKRVNGTRIKVYCFALVLSYSRYKFVWWQEHPFTSDDLIMLHQKAFEYFGGMPKEIVYDQDRIIIVSENADDIICTETFQNYINHMKFKMRLCRAYDPESKGKVEAVVKFAKNNFARHRIFKDIDSFNDENLLWLDRTGNGKVHDITKKVPKEVFTLEKRHLLQIPSSLFNQQSKSSLTYSVRKNNTISYKQNRYQLPKGTYSPGKEVLLSLNGDTLDLLDIDTGEVLATHKIATGKGNLIQIHHPERIKGSNLLALENEVIEYFNHASEAVQFLAHIESAKPRYYRDQLFSLKQSCKQHTTEDRLAALHYCIERNLISASFFKEALDYLIQKLLRDKKSQEKRLKNAAFPTLKTVEEFDLSFQKSINKRQLNELCELAWVDRMYNLILLGPPGVGKSHLAIALGYKAVQEGYTVSFVSMDMLMHTLKTAEISRKSKGKLNRILASSIVIIDELGYLPITREEANLFFGLISSLHEQASLIITSNKGLKIGQNY